MELLGNERLATNLTSDYVQWTRSSAGLIPQCTRCGAVILPKIYMPLYLKSEKVRGHDNFKLRSLVLNPVKVIERLRCQEFVGFVVWRILPKFAKHGLITQIRFQI